MRHRGASGQIDGITGANIIKAKIDPGTLDVIKAKLKKTAPSGTAPAAAPAN